MNILIILYLIEISNNINAFITAGLAIACIVTLGLISHGLMEDKFDLESGDSDWAKERNKEKQSYISMYKIARNISIGFLIATAVTIFIPSKQTMYLMAGAYAAQESGITQKILKVIDSKLDQEISKITEKGE